MKENIALIGMSGTMKSSVGKILAKLTNRLFFDTDEVIEYEQCASIEAIIKKCGEEYFRNVEKKVIKRASECENVVIATGGGVVLNQANMEALKENSVIVLLTASSKEIYERLIASSEKRPLISPLSVESIQVMQDNRSQYYKKYADFVVYTDGKDAITVAEEIFIKYQ